MRDDLAYDPPPEPELVEQFVLNAHGNFDRVRELYAAHPELLNVRFEKFNETALEASGHMGRRDIVEWLLARGAPLTIYAAAMLARRDAVVRFLSEDPAAASRPGVHGFSVMFHAALGGDTDIAEQLLAHDGAIGMGPAVHAALTARHHEMLAWLLAHGAPADAPSYDGRTPLEVAQSQGDEEALALLRKYPDASAD